MTMSRPSAQSGQALSALAAASAAMVDDYDVVGTVARLLAAGVEAVGASAGGVVIRPSADEPLELLTASSHRAEELELYQLQLRQGPCFQAASTGRSWVSGPGRSVGGSWPELAGAFDDAGVVDLAANPLIWHGETIGALNLFWTAADVDPARDAVLIQAFTDMTTLAIVNSGQLSAAQVVERTQAALNERHVVEQAKGVLAYQRQLGMAEAFDLLMAWAGRQDLLLADVAAAVVQAAVDGRALPEV